MRETNHYKNFDFPSCTIIRVNTRNLVCIDLSESTNYKNVLTQWKEKSVLKYFTFTTEEILLLLSEIDRHTKDYLKYIQIPYVIVIKRIYLYQVEKDKWLIQLHIFDGLKNGKRIFRKEKFKKLKFV